MSLESNSQTAEDVCFQGMSEVECQKAILEHVVENIQKSEGRMFAQSKAVQKMTTTVEKFLREKKLMCYGGTAINNILPAQDQFYDRQLEMPDYDFFSPNALQDAKDLADIFHNKGYVSVEAKSGIHHGTYKVYVDFVPVADITHMPHPLFNTLFQESVVIKGIHYAPPNFLRMSMYLELSRPKGMVSRWPKVFDRLQLLNKYYPIATNGGNMCFRTIRDDFQMHADNNAEDEALKILLNIFLDEKVVFFGGMANLIYIKSGRKRNMSVKKWQNIPHYDVLSLQPEKTAFKTKQIMQRQGYEDIKIIKHDGIDEVIPVHYEVRLKNKSMAYIFTPLACHAYNIVHYHNHKIRIATINTILSFYLAFIYSKKEHFDKDRIMCMAQTLFELQQERALQNKGLFRQYSFDCYGKQKQLTNVMMEKSKKFKELRSNRSSPEFESWFLNYRPGN